MIFGSRSVLASDTYIDTQIRSIIYNCRCEFDRACGFINSSLRDDPMCLYSVTLFKGSAYSIGIENIGLAFENQGKDLSSRDAKPK